MNVKKAVKKTISLIATVVLILSTLLCIVLVFKGAFKGNVSLFGYRLFYVLTGSMEPTIHSGAVVLTKESDSYVIGDIITFKSQNSEILGQPNTHRIVDINDDGSFVTKGDANNIEDSTFVNFSEIYGKVVWNSGKLEWFGSLLAFLTTPFGFFIVILFPILLVTVSQLKEFTKAYKEAIRLAAMQKMEIKAMNKEAIDSCFEQHEGDNDERQ